VDKEFRATVELNVGLKGLLISARDFFHYWLAFLIQNDFAVFVTFGLLFVFLEAKATVKESQYFSKGSEYEVFNDWPV